MQCKNGTMVSKASAEKFPRRRRAMEKTRLKNSTFKPPSTLLVLCMKIQWGGARPLPPAAYTHE